MHRIRPRPAFNQRCSRVDGYVDQYEGLGKASGRQNSLKLLGWEDSSASQPPCKACVHSTRSCAGSISATMESTLKLLMRKRLSGYANRFKPPGLSCLVRLSCRHVTIKMAHDHRLPPSRTSSGITPQSEEIYMANSCALRCRSCSNSCRLHCLT
ncbi:hypothetical protein BDY19DRAFT_966026 [Irpex rosettiformis]|uniref:Uncharacterized protein n=1 Tax=Irpex rosettiformis TaxID=378272 RepID=A0ACB8TTW7_9APHY|nr:hypothetical protein BDY19DRAFT_966026 [Irpex rosettiformis]